MIIMSELENMAVWELKRAGKFKISKMLKITAKAVTAA